jgi:hypothetical protein
MRNIPLLNSGGVSAYADGVVVFSTGGASSW